MKLLKYYRQALLLLAATFSFWSCSSEPEYVDPEAHERTIQLNEKYAPLMVGTWYYENTNDTHRFFERMTFKADSTFTGMRKWQVRKLVTIDGKERYTDWESIESLEGTFTGTWSLRYWSPDGNEKRDYLQLLASFDNNTEWNYLAYSSNVAFDYANATTLCFRGIYYNDDGGWAHYQRGDAEPSF